MAKKIIPMTVSAILAAISPLAVSEESKLTLSGEIGVEYDDNISVSVLDTTTGQSDEALVIDLSASYMLTKEETREVELSYDFYQSLHGSLDAFDLQIHTLSALGSWEVNELDTGLDYSYSKIYLGGDALYDSHTITPSLGSSRLENYYHRLSYSFLYKNFAGNSTRDASQNSISADNYYFFMENKAYISLGLRLENEDAKDSELDYDGTSLKLGASIPFLESLKLKANYQHYWRDYDNVTASIGQARDDEQDLFSIELTKSLYKDVSMKLTYEYTDTKSNLPSVDATGNIVSLSFTSDF